MNLLDFLRHHGLRMWSIKYSSAFQVKSTQQLIHSFSTYFISFFFPHLGNWFMKTLSRAHHRMHAACRTKHKYKIILNLSAERLSSRRVLYIIRISVWRWSCNFIQFIFVWHEEEAETKKNTWRFLYLENLKMDFSATLGPNFSFLFIFFFIIIDVVVVVLNLLK